MSVLRRISRTLRNGRVTPTPKVATGLDSRCSKDELEVPNAPVNDSAG